MSTQLKVNPFQSFGFRYVNLHPYTEPLFREGLRVLCALKRLYPSERRKLDPQLESTNPVSKKMIVQKDSSAFNLNPSGF